MAEVKDMDIIKKAAKAVTYLDMELICMGDSYTDIVENICFDAGVVFDTDSEEYEEKEDYLEKKSIEAYEILFSDKKGSYEDAIIEYYVSCSGLLISEMKRKKCLDVKEHPTYNALLDFYTYVDSLEEEYCKKESKDNFIALIEKVRSIDMEVLSVGYEVSSEYWRTLDEKYYFRSNTSYKVGDVVVYAEDEEFSLGQYVSHASIRNGRKYGFSDCGFAIAFEKKNGKVVAHLYEQNKEKHEHSYSYKDTYVEVEMTSDYMDSAKKLAESINKITPDIYPELNIPRYFIIHVNRGKYRKDGYCVLASVMKGSKEEMHIFLKNYEHFVHPEDTHEICYVAEIEEEEYLALKQNADIKIGYGCMLDRKIFSNRDVFILKNICFKNGEDADSSYGFEFQGQWVVNPFMDLSYRFELKDLNEVYEYYSKDEDGMYDMESYTRLYDFLNAMLTKS